MSSNVELVRRNRLTTESVFSSRGSVGRLSNDSSPSVTILSPDGAGPKSGTLKYAKSLKIGAGIWNDILSRAPCYASDWTDAWNYRVVPATTLIFFAKYSY